MYGDASGLNNRKYLPLLIAMPQVCAFRLFPDFLLGLVQPYEVGCIIALCSPTK
jgi:hypothetical protein